MVANYFGCFIRVGYRFLFTNKAHLFWLILGSLSILYLLLAFLSGEKRSYWFNKEVATAIIYVLGIWGSVAVLYPHTIPGYYLPAAAAYLFVALQNLLMFSVYEHDNDIAQQQFSISRKLGLTRIKKLFFVFTSAAFACTIWSGYLAWQIKTVAVVFDFQQLALGLLLIIFMSAGLLLLLIYPCYFSRKERYRYLGDGVFLMPLIFLL